LLLSAGLVEDLREQIVMRVAGLYKVCLKAIHTLGRD
jgi:hypothetical protein